MKKLLVAFFLMVPLISGCGSSVFSSLSKNDSDESVRENAILALDRADYATASANLAKLWERSNSNQNAQLYATSLLGEGGFDLFSIMRNAMVQIGSSSSAGGTDIMNQMTENSEAIFGGTITSARQDFAKRAIDVLSASANPADKGLFFQKCLSASIYSVPILQNVTAVQKKLREIQGANVSAGGAFCSQSSADTIAQMGQGLTDVIAEAGAVASALAPVSAILDECKGGGDKASTLTTQVKALLAKADKGCAYSSGQSLGGIALPSCFDSYVSATGGTAVAGDGQIAGCELFLNCTGSNNCFAL
jgi:hypothetical protein